MNLKDAKGERWTVSGEERSHPMFRENEIEKASAIMETLSGLTIEEAKSILKRASESLDQLVVIPETRTTSIKDISEDKEAIQEIANQLAEILSIHDIP